LSFVYVRQLILLSLGARTEASMAKGSDFLRLVR